MDRKPPNRLLGIVAHPAALIVASIVSVALWMPFGFGYYDFPWKDPFAVSLLVIFVVGFPIAATVSAFQSFDHRFAWLRLAVSLASFFIGLLGLVFMLNWMSR